MQVTSLQLLSDPLNPRPIVKHDSRGRQLLSAGAQLLEND